MKKLFLCFILFLIIGFGLFKFYNINKFKKFESKIEKDLINIDDIYIYGRYLNIKGSSNKVFNDIKDIKLLFKSSKLENRFDINYTNDDSFNFEISSYINDGIDLENINNGKYYIVLEATYNDSSTKYYSFNLDNYDNLNYYSLSNNNKTNKIDITYDKYLILNSKNIKVPSNVYDIVIDAGHGGNDPGAINGNYKEAELTLNYALELKNKLTNLGYKVKLTRYKNETLKTYGKNSRTNIPYEVKAKYLFSIHFNSSENYLSYNGVEIYSPYNTNLKLPTLLSKNITDKTDINYSTNKAFREKSGVYIRTLSPKELNNMKEEVENNNYKAYKADTTTNYLYMLRETGGYMTGAYVDGRNTKYDKNHFVNSNHGTEAYLFELGYINNSHDLEYIVKNKNKYCDVIANSINYHIKQKN